MYTHPVVSTILSCWATSKTGIQTCIFNLFQNMTEHAGTSTMPHTNAKQAKHLHLSKPQIQRTWTLLILSSCPSLSIIAMLSCSGRPSFSQLRVGGGRPVAIHSSSSTLSTATSCSSGDEEPEILGGSNMIRFNNYIRFYAPKSNNKRTQKPSLVSHVYIHLGQSGWKSWYCFLPGCSPHSYKGLHHSDPHQRAGSGFPVHQAEDCGAVRVVGHLLSTTKWEGAHHGPHRSVLPKSLGLRLPAQWALCAQQQGELMRRKNSNG